MKVVPLAAALLEIESLIMNARAQLLQLEQQRFTGLLLEAQAKLEELTAHLVSEGCAPLTELFLAAASATWQGAETQGKPAPASVGEPQP